MAAADKRASLLSDLLAAKGGATGGEAEKPAEPEHPSVISIAKRRIGEERPSEAPAAPGVLYSKGAASASTFRPSYWSFDHDEQAAPKPAPAKAEPALAPTPAPSPVAQAAHAPKSKSLPINLVVAFGCVALFLSTTLFVLSQLHRVEAPAQPQTIVTIAAAPVAPVAPPLPPMSPADTTTAAAVSPPMPVAVAAPVPAPPIAVTPAPTRTESAPVSIASESPPPAPVDPPAKAPVEAPAVTASTPAPPPAPATDTQQAEALLARGDDLLATGDVAAARLFYQRAAELGSAAAATAVGQTYDPGVLELLRVRGARGDVQLAAEWYRKAIAAGDRQAEIRLKRLLLRTSG